MTLDRLDAKKKRLDARRPLPPALVRNLDEWLSVELTYTSNALEGNTLTRRETALVVEKGLTVRGKTLREHLEAVNHAQALKRVAALVSDKKDPDWEAAALDLHRIILKSIDDDAGRYRSVRVRIAGSNVVLPNPAKVPDLMRAFAEGLKRDRGHPVLRAAGAHYDLVTIHPFADGNGRTARLLMNLLLMRAGFPPAIIRQEERAVYLEALETAQLGGSRAAYDALILRAVERSLDIYLDALRPDAAPPAPVATKLLKIGELARAAGEPVSTLRHWTKEGLLHPREHTPGGYALFDSAAVQTARRIRALQNEHLPLSDINRKLSEETK